MLPSIILSLYVYLCICLLVCVYVCVCVCVCVCVSVRLSVYVCVSNSLSICVTVSQWMCLPVCLCVCLSVCLCVCLSVCLCVSTVCNCIHSLVGLSIIPSVQCRPLQPPSTAHRPAGRAFLLSKHGARTNILTYGQPVLAIKGVLRSVSRARARSAS